MDTKDTAETTVPEWQQRSWHESPNLLVNLNLRTLYLQCP